MIGGAVRRLGSVGYMYIRRLDWEQCVHVYAISRGVRALWRSYAADLWVVKYT